MQHIGFIMDGNRRWAKKIMNVVSEGHKKGAENVEQVLSWCLEAGIAYVSLWALSRENILERSSGELEAIFYILKKSLPSLVEKMISSSISLQVVGDLWLLPPDVRQALIDAIDRTASGQKLTCILAIGYSGQDEILRAIRRMAHEGIDMRTLESPEFLQYLDTGSYPPPDLIVRTGGAVRHSGYFLYQSAYSEYYFTEVLWPDFDQSEFYRALAYYDGVKRNFGK